MIAPRYVGASTTTVSPRSRNVLPTSSSASIAPLVISSSSVVGSPALLRLDARRERVERPGEPARRRVLERRASPAAANSCEQRRGALARERQGIGKAAGERDQARHAEEREHLRDPVAHVGPGPRREQRFPLRRRHRHVRHSRRFACAASPRRARAPGASRRSSRRGRTRTSAPRPRPCVTRESASYAYVSGNASEITSQPVGHLRPRDEQPAEQDLREDDRRHELHRLELGARERAREEPERHAEHRRCRPRAQ